MNRDLPLTNLPLYTYEIYFFKDQPTKVLQTVPTLSYGTSLNYASSLCVIVIKIQVVMDKRYVVVYTLRVTMVKFLVVMDKTQVVMSSLQIYA